MNPKKKTKKPSRHAPKATMLSYSEAQQVMHMRDSWAQRFLGKSGTYGNEAPTERQFVDACVLAKKAVDMLREGLF